MIVIGKRWHAPQGKEAIAVKEKDDWSLQEKERQPLEEKWKILSLKQDMLLEKKRWSLCIRGIGR